MSQTLLRDLIELPDHVSRGDFVLSLDRGVKDADATLGEYVVTPKLVEHFDEALKTIQGALKTKKSRGSYLDGSFGSGKSHFMAVLNFLLEGNLQARTKPEFAKIVTAHDSWMQSSKFLMVPFHLIGAISLEGAVLGGYVRHIQDKHPEAPTPAVFRSEQWMENAKQLRIDLGDDTFFSRLNEGRKGDDDGWGDLGDGWDASSFETAFEAGHGHEDYRRLSSDVLDRFFPSIRKEGEYVSFDEGLAVISQHAKALGYDALVLFLDEMILWLASKASDVTFISGEVPKVSKLVESERSERPIPIVSFIARQRDLRDLIGTNVMGSQSLNFADQLKYWEGRFGTIKLEDANLPFIAEKRVLKSKSSEARLQIDAEFERTVKVREAVMNVLLTRHSNKEAFRKLYPFSPALVETLVAVSSLLQRERTALKIMLQLLVEQKDTLRLGELVPVGDLYDQIAQGDEAFSADMKHHFDTAHRLYRQQLRPMLEDQHNLSFEEAAKLDYRDPSREKLRNDDRLIKTLLLAALAPEVESLKNLTPERLAALNHGTIKSPIPGQESNIVLKRLRTFAGHCGQIKIPDNSAQPMISIQLSGVDVEAILDKAMDQDNYGNRIRLLKKKLFEQLSLNNDDSLWITHKFRWKGTDRGCKVFFQNVREADFDVLENAEDEWKVVIDFPIDRDQRGPADDMAKLEKFKEERPSSSTIVWIPSILSQAAQEQLGKLVRLDYILSENRFRDFVQDLSPQDQESARSILRNMRDAQSNSLINQLTVAYGLDPQDKENAVNSMLSLEGEEHFQTLDSSLSLNVPSATQFGPALLELLNAALEKQYPAHPDLAEDLKLTKGNLEKVLDVVSSTLREKSHRSLVPKTERSIVRQIANPLRLGLMGEDHFVIGEHWKDHFNRMAAKENATDDMKVEDLRKWIDQPDAMGLPKPLQQLIILCFAQQTNRSFTLHGGNYKPSLNDLPDECRLKQQSLPSEEEWEKAVELVETALGITGLPSFVSGQNVVLLSDKAKEAAKSLSSSAKQLDSALRDRAKDFGCEDGSAPRLLASTEAKKFIDLLTKRSDAGLIEALAALDLTSPPEAIASSLKQAADLSERLSRMSLQAIHAAAQLPGARGQRGQKLRDDLYATFKNNEYATPLGSTYDSVNRECISLMSEELADNKPPAPQPVPQKKGKTSSVSGDPLPDGFDESIIEIVLTKVEVKTANGTVALSVSKNLEALIKADPDASYDADKNLLSLPKFAWTGGVSELES